MTRLLLIRHGQSEANLTHRFGGQSNFPLTELGHVQAQCTAQFLTQKYVLDGIYTSDLRRSVQTAAHTATLIGLPMVENAGLREIFAGAWEGKVFETLGLTHPEAYRLWRHDFGFARCPEGESTMELAQRVKQAIDSIARKHDGQTIALFTHATPIRAVCWLLSGRPQQAMQDTSWVANASVTEILWEDGILTPVAISQADHLNNLMTNLPNNV